MTTDTNTKQPSPDEDIRADLWHTMSVSQLHRQQDLLLTRITKLQSIMPFGTGTATTQGLLKVLQTAMADLTNLIDNRSTVKPKPGQGTLDDK